jgi:hypothetical protein
MGRGEQANHWCLSLYAVLTVQTSWICQQPGSFQALVVCGHFPPSISISGHLQPTHPSYIYIGNEYVKKNVCLVN